MQMIEAIDVAAPERTATMDGLVYRFASQPGMGVPDVSSGAELARFVFAPGALPRAGMPSSVLSTIVAGDGSTLASPSAIQSIFLSGTKLQPISHNGRVVATQYRTESADYLWIGGITPSIPNASRAAQTDDVFAQLIGVLTSAGMTMQNVVRTWFYLDDILDWYEEFGQVRNRFFEEQGVFDSAMIPASTGIGGANPQGAALSLGALAIKPRTGSTISMAEVESPLQCPATDYRSAFSRALEIRYPDARQVLVSGTASIDGDGRSVYPDDIDAQISKTMEVVAALLGACDMGWRHAVRAIAYCSDVAFIDRFNTYCRENAIEGLPVICAHAAICRSDLLFEIEVDAMVSQQTHVSYGR